MPRRLSVTLSVSHEPPFRSGARDVRGRLPLPHHADFTDAQQGWRREGHVGSLASMGDSVQPAECHARPPNLPSMAWDRDRGGGRPMLAEIRSLPVEIVPGWVDFGPRSARIGGMSIDWGGSGHIPGEADELRAESAKRQGELRRICLTGRSYD